MSNAVLKGGISYFEGFVEYVWHTSDNACEKCQALNGKVFSSIDEIPDLPHPNCKCWVEDRGKKNDVVIYESNKEDEPCDCWEKMEKILDNIDKLEGDVKSEMNEIEKIENNALLSLRTIENLKNKIKSTVSTFKIDISNEAKLKNTVEKIIKDSENAKQVYKIFDDYKTEMEKSSKHNDKYYHTKANCDSARLGILQAGWAFAYSIGKEIKDYAYKIKYTNMTKEEIIKDCLRDLEVDTKGLLQGIIHKSCETKALEMEAKYPYAK